MIFLALQLSHIYFFNLKISFILSVLSIFVLDDLLDQKIRIIMNHPKTVDLVRINVSSKFEDTVELAYNEHEGNIIFSRFTESL